RCGPWLERLAAIRDGLRGLAPDLIGMQEVVRVNYGDMLDQAAQIAEGFGYHIAYARARDDDESYPFRNAILSRWPIVKTESFALPRAGTDEWRKLLYCLIDAPFAQVPFFTTHLNWKLHEGHVREAQVKEITERVRQLAPTSGFPPIVAGDFNAE